MEKENEIEELMKYVFDDLRQFFYDKDVFRRRDSYTWKKNQDLKRTLLETSNEELIKKYREYYTNKLADLQIYCKNLIESYQEEQKRFDNYENTYSIYKTFKY